MSRPKTLAERLQWMADNLPGFREELDLSRQFAKRCAPLAGDRHPTKAESLPSKNLNG